MATNFSQSSKNTRRLPEKNVSVFFSLLCRSEYCGRIANHDDDDDDGDDDDDENDDGGNNNNNAEIS